VSSVAPPEHRLNCWKPSTASGAHALDRDFFDPFPGRVAGPTIAPSVTLLPTPFASWAAVVPRLLTGPEASVRLVVRPVLLAGDKDALLHVTKRVYANEI
jgi:hypothetical protein